MEMLCGECKYYCETCCSKQEAEKRMRIKKLPRVLALHLKRFKFVGVLNKFKKLTYRVVFPFELRLFNTVFIVLACLKSQLYLINLFFVNRLTTVRTVIVFMIQFRLLFIAVWVLIEDITYQLLKVMITGFYLTTSKSKQVFLNIYKLEDEYKVFIIFQKIEVSNFEEFYGLTQDTNKKSETCYILFYESRET